MKKEFRHDLKPLTKIRGVGSKNNENNLFPLGFVREKEKFFNSQSNNFLVWDIETADWIKFLIVGVYDGKVFRTFEDMSDFLYYLIENYDGYNCYAHFGGRFDFLFLLREILRQWNKGKILDLGEIVPRGSGMLCFDLKYNGTTLHFRDSSAFLPFSLARITENFEVTHVKQTIDYTKIKRVTKKLITYLEFDCKGLFESITKYFQWPLIQECGSSHTIASQAIRVLRKFITSPISDLEGSVDKFCRNAYLGGRTEIFRQLYKGNDPLFCYDVNSLYPMVMRNNEYPNRFEYKTYEFEKDRLGIWEGTATVPHSLYVPPLGIIKDNRYIFPTGTFKGFWTTAEINYAVSLGCEFQCVRGHVFTNGGYIFRDFIEYLYAIRLNAKKDGVDNTIAKLLMNSCYGRFGLNAEKHTIVFDDFSEGLELIEDGEITVDGNTYRLAKKKKQVNSFKNVAIAAYVTSYARIHMHKILSKVADSLFYTDTDSIFTTTPLSTGTGLGELKEEYRCNEAVFLLPKTYMAGEKIAMKGFDKKKIRHFHIEDFEACLEGDLKRLKITEEPRFATLKTAIRYGDLVTLTKGGERQIRSRYNKRDVVCGSDFMDTVPLKLKER